MNSKVITTEKKEPAIALDECLLCTKDFKTIFEILQKGSPPWLPIPKNLGFLVCGVQPR